MRKDLILITLNSFWIEPRVINHHWTKKNIYICIYYHGGKFHLIKENTYVYFSISTLFTLDYCQEMVEKEGKGTVPCPLELSDHIEVISESVPGPLAGLWAYLN